MHHSQREYRNNASSVRDNYKLVSKNFRLAASVIRHLTPNRNVYNEITSLRHHRGIHISSAVSYVVGG